jgi:protocatechuate 3,4-dioxygenase beta subunit
MKPRSGDHDEPRGGLPTLIERRHALKLLAGAGVLALAACSSNDGSSSGAASPGPETGGSSTTLGSSTSSDETCSSPIPEETAGPFPGDGSNGPDVLTEDGVVRSDITSSFGPSSGVAQGVPLTIELTVLDDADGCTPLAGAAVYAWHCDREARYSMYSDGAEDENYLRGVQEADADGKVTFTSIFPGAYAGRWPHVHLEVYPSLDEATSAGSPIVTSQLAFPQDVCEVAYATDGYEASVRNLAQTSLESDLVFSDGYDHQLAATTGSADAGYTASLSITV